MIEPHVLRDKRILAWDVCRYCGLVYLNNEITRAAIKFGCNYREHPEFKRIDMRIRNEQKKNN